MRRRYLAALENHLKRIGSEARSERDVKELEPAIQRGFEAGLGRFRG
jgi:hypothetical protein